MRGVKVLGVELSWGERVVTSLLFSCSVTSDSLRVLLWTAAHQASLSFTIFWSLLKLLPLSR